MRNWEDRVTAAGANLICDSVIANDAPDDEAVITCAELGKKAASVFK